ncbi:MAG: ABC transporter substrate-binding protein [Armatimonadota bacterium]|nr:ABC transporter substrate-binding protein [Armatimonadota bacterium]
MIAGTVASGRFLVPYLTSPFGVQAAPAPPPETSTIRLGSLPCDHPIMASEPFLREEGFTNVEILAGGQLASGRTDIEAGFGVWSITSLLQAGQRPVVLAPLHPGCIEIWAQPGIRSLQDLRGRRVVVTARTFENLAYSGFAIVLKQAGLDPAEVNWVIQPDANLVALYLAGQNDAVWSASVGAAALRRNPANPGHVIHNQLMDRPWSLTACCLLLARQEWYRAHPVAAKRAVRAILRAADAQTASRADAVKRATDRGLFGGPANFDNVLYTASMVPANWRDLDMERSLRFYARLVADVGLLTVGVDEVVRTVEPRIFDELRAELRPR